MKKFVLLSVLFLASVHLMAQKPEIFSVDGAAVRGYDVVAYFTEGKPVKGDAQFSYNWKNASWNFANQKNLDAFKADPEKYAPQFVGYCAYVTSNGYKAKTEADAFTIVDGKLYLNYNNEVKAMWSKDQKNLIDKANANWIKIKDQ